MLMQAGFKKLFGFISLFSDNFECSDILTDGLK